MSAMMKLLPLRRPQTSHASAKGPSGRAEIELRRTRRGAADGKRVEAEVRPRSFSDRALARRSHRRKAPRPT